jgi:hypothetical protein
MRLVQLAAREARKADAVNNETASPFCNPLSSLLRGVALFRCW